MEAVLLPAESLLVSIPHLSIDLLNTEIKGTQVEIFHVNIIDDPVV